MTKLNENLRRILITNNNTSIPLGTKVLEGKIVAVGNWFTGERYYWIIRDNGSSPTIDAITVESHFKRKQ